MKKVKTDVLRHIAFWPEDIYPYLTNITSADLMTILKIANSNNNVLKDLEIFLSAGLSPKIVDKAVQQVVLKYTQHELSATADLFLKYKVPMSDDTLYCFLSKLPLSEYAEKIQFPYPIVVQKLISSLDVSASKMSLFRFLDIMKLVKLEHLSLTALAKAAQFLSHKFLAYVEEEFYICPGLYDRTSIFLNTRPFEKRRLIAPGEMFSLIIRELIKRANNDNTSDQQEKLKAFKIIADDTQIIKWLNKDWLSELFEDLVKATPKELYPVIVKRNAKYCSDYKIFYHTMNMGDAKTQLAYCVATGPAAAWMHQEKIEPEARKYLDIVSQMYKKVATPDMFQGLSDFPDVIDTLIETKCDKVIWFKAMENIIKNNPYLPKETINKMIVADPHVKPFIDRYWIEQKNNLNPRVTHVLASQTSVASDSKKSLLATIKQKMKSCINQRSK